LASDVKRKGLSSTLKAPILSGVVYILLALSSGFSFLWGDSEQNLFLSTIVLQILIFILPSLFYSRMTDLSIMRKLKLKIFNPEKLILLLALLGVMIFGSLLVNMVFYYFFQKTGEYSATSAYALTDAVASMNVVYVLLAFCIVPAICEEFVFRGILLSEYSEAGGAAAVFFTSLLFAMSHFDFIELPAYFFSGIVLAASVYVTKSLYASILLHAANNFFSIYLAPYIWTVSLQPRGELFSLFIVTTLFLVCLVIALRESENAYYEYAYDPAYADERFGGVSERPTSSFLSALFSPTLLLCVLCFLIVTLARS
jgi:membrane protease YdiL (CAAX protease family)